MKKTLCAYCREKLRLQQFGRELEYLGRTEWGVCVECGMPRFVMPVCPHGENRNGSGS